MKNQAGRDMKLEELSSVAGGNDKLYNHYGNQCMCPQKDGNLSVLRFSYNIILGI